MSFALLDFSQLEDAVLVKCMVKKTGETYEKVIIFSDLHLCNYDTFLYYIDKFDIIITKMTNIIKKKINVSVTFPLAVTNDTDKQYFTIDLLKT